MAAIFEQLQTYCSSDAYPFHMPGHKRNQEMILDMCKGRRELSYGIDITEIDGFDNLHHAEGILKEAQDRAAELYGAKNSFYLINGSTCGILAAIFACTKQDGTLLMARNCHKAVYHGAELRGLKTMYLYPSALENGQINGVINPEDVKEYLEKYPDILAVLITSPTYDGMVSDVGEIARIVHQYQKYLIVDEAHGAHFGFHSFFPENSLQKGADLVIHSLHKTLPSMTQTALLQVGKESKVDVDLVRKYLGIFETSSPSYVMMAGIDLCIRYLQEKKEELFESFSQRLIEFYQKVERLSHIHLLKEEEQDLSKIVIFADGMDGQELAEILRSKYHLEIEMAARGYVIALTSIFDTEEGFMRLEKALEEIDEKLDFAEKMQDPCRIRLENKSVYRISEAAQAEKRTVSLKESIGRVSAEYIYMYPPGIPLVVPGEQISEELILFLQDIQKKGFELQGMRDYSGGSIQIIDIDA